MKKILKETTYRVFRFESVTDKDIEFLKYEPAEKYAKQLREKGDKVYFTVSKLYEVTEP